GVRLLQTSLDQLIEAQVLPVTRAFNQFLNLANIAEQYHRVRRRPDEAGPGESHLLSELLERLKGSGLAAPNLARQLGRLAIELVLTAHPTEVARRTLIQNYDAIAA